MRFFHVYFIAFHFVENKTITVSGFDEFFDFFSKYKSYRINDQTIVGVLRMDTRRLTYASSSMGGSIP